MEGNNLVVVLRNYGRGTPMIYDMIPVSFCNLSFGIL